MFEIIFSVLVLASVFGYILYVKSENNKPIGQHAKDAGYDLGWNTDCSKWLPRGCSPSDVMSEAKWRKLLKRDGF